MIKINGENPFCSYCNHARIPVQIVSLFSDSRELVQQHLMKCRISWGQLGCYSYTLYSIVIIDKTVLSEPVNRFPFKIWKFYYRNQGLGPKHPAFVTIQAETFRFWNIRAQLSQWCIHGLGPKQLSQIRFLELVHCKKWIVI